MVRFTEPQHNDTRGTKDMLDRAAKRGATAALVR